MPVLRARCRSLPGVWSAPLALLGGCADGQPGAAGLAVIALALVVAAVGFYGLGTWRERVRAERALRAAQAETVRWESLLPHWSWRSDATHHITQWRAGAAGVAGGVEPALDLGALGTVLATRRAFRALRLSGARDADAHWLLDGEPLLDESGQFSGFVGSARACAADDDAALATEALAPLLAACAGPALLARRRHGAWSVVQFNTAAAAHWPGLEAGAAVETLVDKPAAAVGDTLRGLQAGQASEADGWQLVRFGAAPGADGLLMARAAAPAAEGEAFGPTLSHDLRAPIRVVEGFTRIVKEDYGSQLDRVANDHLDRVLGAAARMNHMIDALLTLARLSSQPFARQPVNLSQLAGYVIEDLRRSAPERQVDVEIEPGLGALGDPTLLRMVLENLLGNAWKYTARVPRARISLRRTAQGPRAGFEVADNGAGFDMRSAERLFGLFQRLHSQSEFPGHGVGLASVRRIVQRHGGEIWASAEPGRGAVFTFTLA